MTNWLDELSKLVDSRWGTIQKPVFVSQVRTLLKRAGLELPAEAFEVGVKVFLETNASHRFQVARPTDDSKDVRWALAPASLTREEIFDKYLAEKDQADSLAEDERFHKAVWSAFHIPVEEGTERYLNLIGRPSFLNVPSGNAAPEGWDHIPSSDLHKGNDDVAVDSTEKNLRRWFQRNEKDLKQGIWKDSGPSFKTDGSFFLAMSRLSERELSRISVPLDLVVKILDK